MDAVCAEHCITIPGSGADCRETDDRTRRSGDDLEGNASLVWMRRAEGAAYDGRRRQAITAHTATINMATLGMLQGASSSDDNAQPRLICFDGSATWSGANSLSHDGRRHSRSQSWQWCYCSRGTIQRLQVYGGVAATKVPHCM